MLYDAIKKYFNRDYKNISALRNIKATSFFAKKK